MILRANVALSTPVSGVHLALAVKALVLALTVLLASQYLAGYFFLWWSHLEPRDATPLTIARYAYYFGERTDVQRQLLWCSGASLTLVAITVVAAWPRSRRSLHGDARFASRS